MRYNWAFLSHFRFSLITYHQCDDYGWSYVVILQDMGQAKPERSVYEKNWSTLPTGTYITKLVGQMMQIFSLS